MADEIQATPLTDADLDKYGALMRAFKEYFPSSERPDNDRSDEFVADYRRNGERDVKFEGILEQIKLGMREPNKFSRVFNHTTGMTLTADQCSGYLSELYNLLTNYDPKKVEAKDDSDALLAYYAGRKVTIPYWNKDVPIWLLTLAAAVVAGLGWAGVSFLDYPVIHEVSLALLVLGTVVFTLGVLVMYWLRDEVVNAEKYERREQALKERGGSSRGNFLSRFRK